MALREILLSGVETDQGVQIEPPDVYCAVDGVYANAKHVGYTGEDVKIKITPKFAELVQKGVKKVRKMTGNAMTASFTLKSWMTSDQLALAIGTKWIDPDANPGYDRIHITSTYDQVEPLWIFRTSDIDGNEIEVVFHKAPVNDPGEFGIGGTGEDFTSVAVNLDALAVALNGTQELGYIDIEQAA